MLFTAGLLGFSRRGYWAFHGGATGFAAQLNLALVIPGAVAAAILGDQVGYAVGRRVGPKLCNKPDARIFKQAHLTRANSVFERYGTKTVLLARFIPVVRTFAPTLAGAAGMTDRRFVTFNIVGGMIWAVGVPLTGFTLGKAVPSIDRYLLPAIAVIIVVSLLPVAVEALRHRRVSAR